MTDESKLSIPINRGMLRWIVLTLGVLGLIVAAVALVVTPGNQFNTVSISALAVGVLGLAGFILLDPASIVQVITARTGQYAIATWGMSLAFVALVIVGYVVLRQAKLQPVDLTESNLYSISDETKRVLAEMTDPVKAYAFYTDVQADQADEARLWLDQYERASSGQFSYQVIDPERDPATAQRLGVTRTGVIVLERGEITAEAGFLSEREITGALVRVLLGEPRIIYATSGHGERDFNDFGQQGYSTLAQLLQRYNFEVRPLNLLQEGAVPEDADIVLVGGATSQFAQSEIDALRDYAAAGGKLFVLADPGAGTGALGNGLLAAVYSPDGARLATAGSDGAVTIWDVASGVEVMTLRGHTRDVLDVAYSPDGRQIASVSADGTARLWDARSGEEIAQLAGQTDLASRVAFSPDGSLVATAGEDQVINVWHTDTLELTDYSPLTATVPLFSLAFSPDGKYIAAGGGRSGAGAGGFALVWDAATGEQVLRQALHDNIVFDLVFSADSSTLYTTSVDGSAGTITLETGASSVDALFSDAGITSVDAAPDGTLFYGLGNGTLHYGNRTINAHTDLVWDISVSPDGASVATAGRDGAARIWDIATGEQVAEFTAQAAAAALDRFIEVEWGIALNNDLVVDLDTQGEFSVDTPVSFTFNTLSPIMSDFNLLVFFPVARSLTLPEQTIPGITVDSLMTTSPNPGRSWGETNRFGVAEFGADDIPGPVSLAVSGDNTLNQARIVVVGDADFVSNNWLQYAAYGNDQFFLNAANWLVETDTAFDLPSPEVGERTMEPLGPVGLGLTVIISVCLLPATVAAGGALLWFSRRRRR